MNRAERRTQRMASPRATAECSFEDIFAERRRTTRTSSQLALASVRAFHLVALRLRRRDDVGQLGEVRPPVATRLLERLGVFKRGLGDGVQRLVGEERLMRRDHHVRQVHQARERVVGDGRVRPVLEEVRSLVLVHVEAGAAEVPVDERAGERLRVDDRPAARVDDDGPLGHRPDARLVDQVLRLLRQRQVQREHVGAPHELLQVSDFRDTELLGALVVQLAVPRHDVHAVPTRDADEATADLAAARDAGGEAVQVAALKSG
mmetsp:Transcript_30881/g.95347  ORF Transcript_30881/g.95347 Transcript_30881/m.95347 type:complete len:262 (-) Transcript_30881:963-1748(-)